MLLGLKYPANAEKQLEKRKQTTEVVNAST